jgi:hypothetical protein
MPNSKKVHFLQEKVLFMFLVSLLFLQFLTGQHHMIEFTRCKAVALYNTAGNDARRR